MARFCPAISTLTINDTEHQCFNDFYDFFDRCYWEYRSNHNGISTKFTKYGTSADPYCFSEDIAETCSQYFQPFLNGTSIRDFTFNDDPISTDSNPISVDLDIVDFEDIKINGTRMIEIFEEMFWMHKKISGSRKQAPKLANKQQVQKKTEKDFKLDDTAIQENDDWVFCGTNTSTRRVYKHIPGNATAKFDTLDEAIEASDQYGGRSITLCRDGKYQLREQTTVYPDYREAGSWVLKDTLKNGKLKVSGSCPSATDPLKLDSCNKKGMFWEQTQW